jgi:hypothetical protein
MGACDFTNTAIGTSAEDAFNRITESTRYEYGHGGYTGTIAEKHGFRVFPLPDVPGLTPSQVADFCISNLYDDEDDPDTWTFTPRGGDQTPVTIPREARRDLRQVARTANDKWGDAACFDITGTPQGQKALEQWVATEQRTGAFEVDRRGKRTRLGPEPTTAGKRVFLFFGMASS